MGVKGKRKIEYDYNEPMEVNGHKVDLNLSPLGFDLKLIPVPIFNEETDTISSKCNEEDYTKAKSAVEKAAKRKGVVPTSPQIIPKFKISHEMTLNKKINVDI